MDEFVSSTTMKWEDCSHLNNKDGRRFKAEDAPWSVFVKFESQMKSNQDTICSGTLFC